MASESQIEKLQKRMSLSADKIGLRSDARYPFAQTWEFFLNKNDSRTIADKCEFISSELSRDDHDVQYLHGLISSLRGWKLEENENLDEEKSELVSIIVSSILNDQYVSVEKPQQLTLLVAAVKIENELSAREEMYSHIFSHEKFWTDHEMVNGHRGFMRDSEIAPIYLSASLGSKYRVSKHILRRIPKIDASVKQKTRLMDQLIGIWLSEGISQEEVHIISGTLFTILSDHSEKWVDCVSSTSLSLLGPALDHEDSSVFLLAPWLVLQCEDIDKIKSYFDTHASAIVSRSIAVKDGKSTMGFDKDARRKLTFPWMSTNPLLPLALSADKQIAVDDSEAIAFLNLGLDYYPDTRISSTLQCVKSTLWSILMLNPQQLNRILSEKNIKIEYAKDNYYHELVSPFNRSVEGAVFPSIGSIFGNDEVLALHDMPKLSRVKSDQNSMELIKDLVSDKSLNEYLTLLSLQSFIKNDIFIEEMNGLLGVIPDDVFNDKFDWKRGLWSGNEYLLLDTMLSLSRKKSAKDAAISFIEHRERNYFQDVYSSFKTNNPRDDEAELLKKVNEFRSFEPWKWSVMDAYLLSCDSDNKVFNENIRKVLASEDPLAELIQWQMKALKGSMSEFPTDALVLASKDTRYPNFLESLNVLDVAVLERILGEISDVRLLRGWCVDPRGTYVRRLHSAKSRLHLFKRLSIIKSRLTSGLND